MFFYLEQPPGNNTELSSLWKFWIIIEDVDKWLVVIWNIYYYPPMKRKVGPFYLWKTPTKGNGKSTWGGWEDINWVRFYLRYDFDKTLPYLEQFKSTLKFFKGIAPAFLNTQGFLLLNCGLGKVFILRL